MIKLRILLVNPNLLIQNQYKLKDISPPIGLACLASMLIRNGYKEVEIVDSLAEGEQQKTMYSEKFDEYGLYDNQLKEKIEKYSPDIVGIGCTFSCRYPLSVKIANIVKSIDKSITTVMGGIHPSTDSEGALKHKAVDCIVYGEGEKTFLELVNCLRDRKSLEHIKGIGYKHNGEICVNPSREYIDDLDSLPFPARYLLPFKKYIKYNRNSVFATRGCPYSCVFCSMQTVMGHKFRRRSSKNFVDEIEAVKKDYKTDFFSFDDDNLTLSPSFTREFCSEIIERKLRIHWNVPNGVNINSLSFENLKLMKKAGCYSLCLAIESADPKILKLMRKNVSLEKVKDITRWCRELKIFTLGFFLIGIPGETVQSIERTIEFALSIPIDATNISIVTPFPGTQFYKDCLAKGYIANTRLEEYNIHDSNITTEFITADALKQFQQKFIKLFEDSKNPAFPHEQLKLAVRNPLLAPMDKLYKEYF